MVKGSLVHSRCACAEKQDHYEAFKLKALLSGKIYKYIDEVLK